MSRKGAAIAGLLVVSSCAPPPRINSPFVRAVEDDGTTNCIDTVATTYEKWASENELGVDGEREEARLAFFSQIPGRDLYVELYYRVRSVGTELSLALTQASSTVAPDSRELAKQYRLSKLWIELEGAARCGSDD